MVVVQKKEGLVPEVDRDARTQHVPLIAIVANESKDSRCLYRRHWYY